MILSYWLFCGSLSLTNLPAIGMSGTVWELPLLASRLQFSKFSLFNFHTSRALRDEMWPSLCLPHLLLTLLQPHCPVCSSSSITSSWPQSFCTCLKFSFPNPPMSGSSFSSQLKCHPFKEAFLNHPYLGRNISNSPFFYYSIVVVLFIIRN